MVNVNNCKRKNKITLLLLLLNGSMGCAHGDNHLLSRQVTDESLMHQKASQIFDEVKSFFLGEKGKCAPLPGPDFDEETVEAIKAYSSEDVAWVSFMDQYRISFVVKSDDKIQPLSLDVALENGRCLSFDIAWFYSDPM